LWGWRPILLERVFDEKALNPRAYGRATAYRPPPPISATLAAARRPTAGETDRRRFSRRDSSLPAGLGAVRSPTTTQRLHRGRELAVLLVEGAQIVAASAPVTTNMPAGWNVDRGRQAPVAGLVEPSCSPYVLIMANASARGQRAATLASPLHELTGFCLAVDCLASGCAREHHCHRQPEPLRANEDETSTTGEFRLEGAEGLSRTCPCSRHRLMPRLATSRTEAEGRRLWRRQPRHHPNYRNARAAGRSLRRTSYASWPRPLAPLRPGRSARSCVARGFTHRLSLTDEGSATPGPSPHWFLANAARRLPNPTRLQPK